MPAQQPFSILLIDDAAQPVDFAFEESARVAKKIPEARIHVLYLAPRFTPLSELEGDATARAASLATVGPLEAIHLRAGDAAREAVDVARDTGASLVIIGGLKRSLRERVVDALYGELGCPSVIAAPPRNLAPEIEPLCADCVNARRRGEMWCEVHSHHHAKAHTYSYRRDIPLSSHNSNVIPTGIAFR
jgi:hypothetical protein